MNQQEHDRYLTGRILQLLCSSGDSAAKAAASQSSDGLGALIRFMDEMPGGFLIYYADQDEKIIYANRSLLRIFQCDTMEEFRDHTSNSFRGLVHPEDLDRVEQSIREQIAGSQYDLDYVEYRIRRKDGVIRWIEDYGHFVRVPMLGDIFYVFLGDATEKHEKLLSERARFLSEKREGEQRLKDLSQAYDKERSLINREYLQQLEVIEGLSINYEGICYLDLDADQIIPYRLSVRTRAIFHARYQPIPYSRYEKEYLAMWVHPDDRDLVARSTAPGYIRAKLAESKTYYFNYRVQVDGEIQYLQLRVVNVGRNEQACQAVFGYRRVDEEIRQQMEQQTLLSEALAKANLAISSKNAFLSNMSHDMRTPLNIILGFASLAKLNIENPEVIGYLDQVETAGKTLLEMIQKVLEIFSLSEAVETQEVECDLRELLQEIHDFLRPQAQEKDISFQLDCAALRHSAVYGDREKIRQMALYLANNALTYTNPGGHVTIRVAEGEELTNHYAVYRLIVQDTGIGISPDFLEQIFDPFSREKNSTLSGVHGIGLGLTVVKRMVDLMNGDIQVQSEVGKGSEFTVTLNLRQQVLAIPERPAEKGTASQRILLAEDNEINREIEMELLQPLGFEVDAFENGRLALEKLLEAPAGYYDLVLTDLQMPEMDGWEMSAAIRALPDRDLARIPIIALSANVQSSDQAKSQRSGINAHLVKPMDLPLMLRTIERLTGRSAASPRE